MADGTKMICQDCGVEMNRHAEKLDYVTDLTAGGAFDQDLGGVLEEFHTCPDCGVTLARAAGQSI